MPAISIHMNYDLESGKFDIDTGASDFELRDKLLHDAEFVATQARCCTRAHEILKGDEKSYPAELCLKLLYRDTDAWTFQLVAEADGYGDFDTELFQDKNFKELFDKFGKYFCKFVSKNIFFKLAD